MRIFITIIYIVALVCFANKASAFTATLTGATVDVSYTEPTINEDGSPLTDLDKTVVYYDKGDGIPIGLDIPGLPRGGAAVKTTLEITVAPGQEIDVSIWAVAADKSGNESVPTPTQTVRIDKLSPGVPK